MATIGHVVKMLEDSSVPLTQHERLIKILGSSHSAGADQSYQCLAHHLKGLNSKSSATSKNIAAKCATQDRWKEFPHFSGLRYSFIILYFSPKKSFYTWLFEFLICLKMLPTFFLIAQ